MNKNFKKIVSMILLLAMVMSVMVIVPVSAELSPLPDATDDYTSGVFIACRTIDEEGNPTDIALYTQNQKVIFELRAYNANQQQIAVAGFNYSIYADGSGSNAVKTGFAPADAETGVALVETTTMNQPGLLRITADIADENGDIIKAYRTSASTVLLQAGVLVDAQAITTTADPIPADELREVWDEQLALQVDPEILKITKLDSKSTDKLDVYAIYIDSIGNPDDITRPSDIAEDAVGPETGATHAFAYMTVPKGKEPGTLDVKFGVQGYGISSGSAGWDTSYIYFSISAHSLESIEGTDITDFKAYYTDWILGGASYGFDKNGLTTNAELETCYFRNMLLRDVNVVRFALEAFGETGATISDKYDETDSRTMAKSELETLIDSWKGLLKPEDERVVEISGGSQGGFQAIGVAAILSDVITSCKSQITWLADVCSNTDATNIPCGFRPNPTKAEGADRSALEYVDSANMAQLITCKTEVSPARLGDLTSPPSGVMAMYNNLTRGKANADDLFSIKFVQGVAHGFPSSYSSTTQNFISNYCTSTISGALAPEIEDWSIDGTTLTIYAKGILEATTGDKLWEADPAFATVDTIVLGEGVVALGQNAFELAKSNVTVKLPSTVNAISDDAFGTADLTKYTIRSYNDTFAESYANRVGATFVTLGDISSSGAYAYTIDGSVLNLISTGKTSILTADATLQALAIANAEKIKTIEIEGKFASIGSLEAALKYFTRVENIKIDVQTNAVTEGATNIFANAASLISLGHVEFDAMGAPVADTGTYKKGEIALGGFTTLGEGILSGDRSATTVYVGGTAIPAKAFENAVSLKTVYMLAVTDTATIASDAFVGTSGVKIIVNDETAKTAVEAALTASNITNVTVAVKEAEVAFGDKTGAAGSDAKWKIKGSTLIISGTGAVTKLEDFAEEDKAGINNIVISDGITSISNDVIAGFTLERVTIKGATAPAADDGVFGVQSADFVVYVTPDTQGVGETLYGYTVEIDGATAGDLNGDGDINATDAVILSQVLASWDVDYNANAADCNGDGEVNAMDSVLLAQYIANWDVSLGVTTGGGDIEIPGSDLLD